MSVAAVYAANDEALPKGYKTRAAFMGIPSKYSPFDRNGMLELRSI
jgi:hypothetical protein